MDKIILTSKILNDNYTNYVCEKYDIQAKDELSTIIPETELDLTDNNWNIGLICGNSGSGKSTILRKIGNIIEPKYDNNKCVVSQFPFLSEKDVCSLLNGVGLSSVPLWLNKPNNLSNGEKARLDICWQLANNSNDIILIDEYTSTVNRPCAQSMSFALQRYIRKHNKKIILASCHFDLIEWLQPDWIINLNKQKNDKVELEKLIYNDNDNYNIYNNINKSDILYETNIN